MKIVGREGFVLWLLGRRMLPAMARYSVHYDSVDVTPTHRDYGEALRAFVFDGAPGIGDVSSTCLVWSTARHTLLFSAKGSPVNAEAIAIDAACRRLFRLQCRNIEWNRSRFRNGVPVRVFSFSPLLLFRVLSQTVIPDHVDIHQVLRFEHFMHDTRIAYPAIPHVYADWCEDGDRWPERAQQLREQIQAAHCRDWSYQLGRAREERILRKALEIPNDPEVRLL